MGGCTRDVRRRGTLGRSVVTAVALVAFWGASSRAADIETRDFAVIIAGKPSGEVHMTIHRQDTGAIWMRCDTDIKFALGLLRYKFVYRGLEVWKDQRLVQLDSQTDDNGKMFKVTAVAQPNGLKVKVNNAEQIVSSGVWLTSYWCLPDPKLRNGTLSLLDADSGRLLDGKLSFVGNEKMRIAGQEVTLNHYRLTGKVQVDLWYDGSERLVRQEWTEQGHKTVLELARVRR